MYSRRTSNPNNPVVILRFAIITSSSDSADRGRSIIRVNVLPVFIFFIIDFGFLERFYLYCFIYTLRNLLIYLAQIKVGIVLIFIKAT